jgi:hypothetical protein
MKDAIRSVAIVFNILALGAMAFMLSSSGTPHDSAAQLFVLVVIGAQVSSLIAFFAKQ